MRVILIQDVPTLGKVGDVKEVADGYGRNYLIPKGLAILASYGALRNIDDLRRAQGKKMQRQIHAAEDLANTLGQLNLRVRTGAAVLAIHREGGDRVQPTPRDRLELHDIVVLAGAPAAVAAATDILHGGPALDPTYHQYSS